MISRHINVNFTFEGFHQYKQAPKDVAFLKDLHRHVFHVSVTIEVYHDNRELEFINVKRMLESRLDELYPNRITGSCETIAIDYIKICEKFYGSDRRITVSVSEDGENGAICSNH